MHSTKSQSASAHYSDGSSITSDNESCSQAESWENSHSSSCSSCSESSLDEGSVEWEAEIRSDGELYYIESDRSYLRKSNDANIGSHSNAGDGESNVKKEPVQKSWRNGGKLVRLIRRRESKRHRSNPLKGNSTGTGNTSQDSSAQHSNILPCINPKETAENVVELHVDPWAKQNLGRRATISETLLGLVTNSEGTAVVITDFVPDGVATKQSLISIGDKICSINGKGVSVQNFNFHLEAIHMPTTIYLGICSDPKHSEEKQSNSDRSHKISYQTPLAERICGQSSENEDISSLHLQCNVGVTYLQLDGLTEGGPEDQGVLYCYPGTFKTNILGSVRGAFLTLFQLIPEITHSIPTSSSILIKNQLVHVIYVQEAREILLFAIPSTRCSLSEATKQCSEFVRFLQYSYQSLSRCFSSQKFSFSINHHVSVFLSRLLWSEKWADITDTSSYRQLTARLTPAQPQFELVLPAAHIVPLPREAQMQIDDALSELESNDIGDSCEDLDCQRLYTILGCCLYHKGYLLSSHLMHTDLFDVHSFLRQQGLLQLNRSESVRSLVIWKEVFPSSVSRGLESSTSDLICGYNAPEGRWFLLIVGQKQDMLVTLLEAGGCSVSADGYTSPDVFYVEAAQDTLQHLRKTGISSIASEWIETQLRPKVVTPEAVAASKLSSRKVNNLLGLRVHHDPGWQSNFSSIINPPSTRKSTDSLTAGKRKPSPDHSGSGPLHGGETSEDSASLVASLPSDDTGFLTGKGRAEGTHISHSDHEASDDSESDWEASDTQTGRRITSTTDLSDLHNSLLKNVEGTVPSKLTTGVENIVFHYVHLDTNEGVLLSPVHSSLSANTMEILSKFRQSAMHIHNLFQNTISFKKLKGSEGSHSINKSLVAIKEFGVLFECQLSPRVNEKVTQALTYWVVGRLFFMPSPREVYVCYEDSSPQNMVELAFRLALTTSG